MGLLKEIKKQLFTIEDKYNFHKSLGIFCLISYFYRFVKVGPTDMGFGATAGTLMVTLTHMALSVSSLIFRIPHARIKSGYRIWPEYRIHSIVFACRSLFSMLLTWFELKFGFEPNYLLNAGIVLGTIVAADLGSASMGPAGSAGRSSTIRDLEAGPATRFFFSAMQFHATMGCMLGIRRFSTMFLYVWIIQFNAFLMTLRRKNLAPHNALVTMYGLMLTFGFVVASYEAQRVGMFLMVNTLGNFAGCLRMGLGMNKYPMCAASRHPRRSLARLPAVHPLLRTATRYSRRSASRQRATSLLTPRCGHVCRCRWILMAALTQVSRISVQQPDKYPVPWLPLYGASVALLLGIGAKKIFGPPRKPAADASAADGKAGEPKPSGALETNGNVTATPPTGHLKAS